MRRLTAMLIGLLALSLVATDAWAHGGQFRGPFGGVPPGLRTPGDPEPPPPPPITGVPPQTPPTTGSGGPPSPTTVGPAPSPVTGGLTNGGPRPRGKSLTYDDFSFWYLHNNSDIEFLKDSLYASFGSGSILGDLQGRDAGNRSDRTHEIRAKVGSTIIPALLWAMDPTNAKNADVESAAYIALAKVARDPVHIDLIKKGLDLKQGHHNIVLESAALALGLLRRADASEQFTAAELDRVRSFLLDVFLDEDYPTRTRGMAVLSIGLLGDQPTGSGTYASDTLGAKRATTGLLFEALKNRHSQQDLTIGLLMAIGLQSGDSIDKEQRAALHACVTRGRLYREDAPELVRSYAALTLGRIGNASDIPVLRGALLSRRGRSKSAVIQRSAAIGLGQLSRLVTGADRVAIAESLLASRKKVRDAGARNFVMISLAYCINEDVKTNKTDVIDATEAETYLLETSESGKYTERPYGAMATALVARAIGEKVQIIAYGELRQQYLDALRSGLQSSKLDTRGRAAFATALGISRDERSVKVLTEIVADRDGDHQLRGYAALGLGLIGSTRKDTLVAIRRAMKERRSEEMRVQCATALGLLRDVKAVDLLLEELKTARSQSVKGQVVLALAKIGDERAVEPMAKLLRNPKEQGLTRALACAGLGVIGDLESIPSLARLSKNVNYRAHCDLMAEVLTII